MDEKIHLGSSKIRRNADTPYILQARQEELPVRASRRIRIPQHQEDYDFPAVS
jgi:hypothetical protein